VRRVTSTATTGRRYRSWSLRIITQLFSAAAEPLLDQLVGTHHATALGPWWVRRPAPLLLAATGMPGWWGKEFAPPSPSEPTTLAGHNLRESDGRVVPSLAMTARLGRSRVDSRPAVVLTYEPGAPWPWRGVTDEVRPLEDGLLLGLSFDIVAKVPIAAPFLLERR